MSTAELKSYLHKLTVETNEDSILQQVIDYFSSVKKNQEKDWWDDLSDNEKASIEKGLEDYKKGNVFTSKQVKEEMAKKYPQLRF